MDLKTAASLIKSEYAERQAAARERYIKLLDSDEALYAAEKTLRAAILDGKSDGEIAAQVSKMFDLRPSAIERELKLRQPMYLETAAYGHMGRKNEVVKKTFTSRYHEEKTIDVELFTWEKLDLVDKIRSEFGLGN